MSIAPRTSYQPGRGRVVALDLLRLLAALLMVQGHTLDAVLATEARAGDVHAAWVWSRGLTSVAFLFAAGLSFHLATLRNLGRHKRDRGAVLHRFRRAGLLIALGYLLHLPVAALFGADSRAADAAFQNFVAVDVLQCIGVCLALLEGLALMLPSRRAVEYTAGVLGAFVLGVAPHAVAIDPTGAWAPLLHYVTPRGGSLFPIFPWAAHILLGVALGGVVLRREAHVSQWLLGLLFVFAAAQLVAFAGAPLAHQHLVRLSSVLFVCVALAWLGPIARTWPAWLLALSGETLFIYAFHVLLVYGSGIGLAALIGATLAPLTAIALALCVIALSFALALPHARAVSGLARRVRKG